MESPADQLNILTSSRKVKPICVETFGQFQLFRENELVKPKEWGRDKSIQLFQFFLTSRNRRALHKEQIADRLWDTIAGKAIDQTFKVSLHGINKVLEPDRQKRSDPKYLIRQGISYQLSISEMWIDADVFEQYIKIGNDQIDEDPVLAIQAYTEAIELYKGIYLPNRMYEDWSSAERERLQLLALGALVSLAEMLVNSKPMESIRLSQQALQLDNTWEDAYRIQMQAYFNKGNRPMALKTFKLCKDVLKSEFGIEPLPETKELLQVIESA